VLAAGIARNPQDRRLLKCAAEDALRQDELARAEGLLGRAAEIYPPEWGSLVELSYLYLRNHQFAQAAALRARMRLLAVTDERMLRCYAVLSSFLGDEAQAQAFLGKADELFLRQEAPKHRDTYRKMAQAVLSRKLALFCMQYPMRKLEQLKAMTGELEGAQFVDNEGIFKDAVKGGSYGDYFIDQYGGDFGHLTAKGNELLARHLADQVLKTTGL